MTEVQKTIRMPAALLAKWLAALRSSTLNGKPITQAKGKMTDTRGGYCCLGVLCKITTGRISNHNGSELPSLNWLAKNNISFTDEHGKAIETPFLHSFKDFASNANDQGGTFHEIADAIEACAEGYE